MLVSVPLVFCYTLSQLVPKEPLSHRRERDLKCKFQDVLVLWGLWSPHPTVSSWEGAGAGSSDAAARAVVAL